MLFNPPITVWLYQEKVDMRKQIDGLSILVSSNMSKNPCNGEIFMSLGGIGLTPSPLGEYFSIVQGCTIEKVRTAHMI